METLKLPKGALRLVAHGSHAHIEMTKEGDKDVPKLKMTVYSGGFIEGHWYWGKLAVDLQGIKFDRSKYPILETHMTSRKVGFSGKPVINGSIILDPDSVTLLDNEVANEFIDNSRKGFPYQASLYAIPMRLERVEEGAVAEVNGLKMKGPGVIWRECLYQESSICVFGWDKKTEASVFSKEETEIKVESTSVVAPPKIEIEETDENKQTKGGDNMKLDELKTKFPELVEQIEAALSGELEEKFSKERADLKAENDRKLEEKEDRILSLEKKDTLRDEREMKTKADKIWIAKLTESEVAEHLWDKIQRHVLHGKFVKEGVLDEAAFSKAIKAEIEDWEKRGATQKVMGSGSLESSDLSADDPSVSKKEQEEIDKETKSLLKLAGQETKEETT